jgi:hypothetical protein
MVHTDLSIISSKTRIIFDKFARQGSNHHVIIREEQATG